MKFYCILMVLKRLLNKLILFGMLAFGSLLGYAEANKEGTRPNVVFIVADDFGWADTGFQGSEFYETPNLDKLAAEGVLFSDGYAASGVCSPSRASLLTGRYTPRSGITDWIRGYQAGQTPQQLSEYKMIGPENVYNLPLEELTIAEVLKQNGYKTCFVGKWHLGEDDEHYPHHQGFDKNVAGWKKGSPSGSRTNNQSYYTPYNNPYITDGEDGEFLTDRLVDESIQWINDNENDPFLLYLSFYVVHTPIHPKPEKIPYYTEKAKRLGIDTQPQTTKDVEWIQNSPNPKWHWNERIIQGSAEYAALIESMDENIGRVLNHLKAKNLDENTIVVFTSDNGGLSTAETSPTCNAPLRGGKGWLYEGGIREPYIVKIPGQSQPGKVCNTPVHGVDLYPTVIDACGLEIPNLNEIDGVSLLPLLSGGALSRDKLFWHYPHYGGKGDAPAGAIRKGDYKLIELFESGEVELYNLKEDISESNDLSAVQPEKTKELWDDLKQWRNDIGAKMPEENPYYKYSVDVYDIEDSMLIDFEKAVDAETAFGATFSVVENINKEGLNKSGNCGKIGRTSELWYELVDIACNFSVPANESRYVHVKVNFPKQPDLILRLNKSGNEGNVRAINKYNNLGEWQDIVFQYHGGENGISVEYLRFMFDCGFENSPKGFVLDNSSSFGYIDEIILSGNPKPRSINTGFTNIEKSENCLIYAHDGCILINTDEDRKVDVCIYDLNGRIIASHYKSTHRFDMPSSGLYVVRVGDQIQKVWVK